MICFISFKEGGKFRRHYSRLSPKKLLEEVLALHFKLIIVFKTGKIWDGFLPQKRGIRTHWRHCITGGRREGKKYYKYLMESVE